MATLTDLNNEVSAVISKGYKPTKSAYDLVHKLGVDKTTDAYVKGNIKLKVNDTDKTFDITVSEQFVNNIFEDLRKALDKKGYCLTVKGEKYIAKKYNPDNFLDLMENVSKRISDKQEMKPHIKRMQKDLNENVFGLKDDTTWRNYR